MITGIEKAAEAFQYGPARTLPDGRTMTMSTKALNPGQRRIALTAGGAGLGALGGGAVGGIGGLLYTLMQEKEKRNLSDYLMNMGLGAAGGGVIGAGGGGLLGAGISTGIDAERSRGPQPV